MLGKVWVLEPAKVVDGPSVTPGPCFSGLCKSTYCSAGWPTVNVTDVYVKAHGSLVYFQNQC